MALLKKRLKGKEPEVAKSQEAKPSYPTSIADYQFEGRIGRGAFASVYIAQCSGHDEKVAIKVIELELTAQQDGQGDGDDGGGDNDISWDEIQKEAAIMARMQHRNIVSCHTSFCVGTELWLVMPLLIGSCSDIMKVTEQLRNGLGPDEALIATVIRDVLSAVHYIHTDGRVHRDIKAANILIRNDGVCQLSDFGVSGAIIEGGLRKNGRHTFTGSLWWMAPEVLQRENRHSYKADMWSLGILALELTFGKPPHSKQRPVKVMLTILQSPPPTIESMLAEAPSAAAPKYSKKFKDFLGKCLQKDANKRGSAAQLLQHSWMKSAKTEEYVRERILKLYVQKQPVRNDLMPVTVQQRLKKLSKQRLNGDMNPMMKAASSATMDSIRVESNGFDFSSAINSVSRSGQTHSPLSPDQDQKEAPKQMGRFDVTVQNKQKAAPPPQAASEAAEAKSEPNDSVSQGDGNESNVTKGRFKIKKIT